MEKKILIVSIISIAVLIGISFTSVVGYQSVKSDLKASPLFNIRTSRAIDEDAVVSTSNYFGKGKKLSISVPRLKNSYDTINNVMMKISLMEEKDFQIFINSMINYIVKTNRFGNIDTQEIILILSIYNKNPGRFQEELNDRNALLKYYNKTLNFDCTLNRWVPGCFIMWGIRTVLIYLALLFLTIYYFVSAYIETCMLYDTCFMCIDFNDL